MPVLVARIGPVQRVAPEYAERKNPYKPLGITRSSQEILSQSLGTPGDPLSALGALLEEISRRSLGKFERRGVLLKCKQRNR